jgi:CRP-like cAMP-binding protein
MKCDSIHCKNCPAFSRSAFASLSEKGLNQIDKEKKNLTYEKSQAFSEQGEKVDSVYCLQSGSAKVTWHGKNNRKSIVRLATSGDLLGYRCIFTESTYRATASALENSRACKIDKDLILKLIETEPKFAKELLVRMGREIARAENHHHAFVQNDSRERLAQALLQLYQYFGHFQNGKYIIQLPLTRLELSNWIGIAKETCIRQLSDFKSAGWIEWETKNIELKKIPALLQLAGEKKLEGRSQTSES